MFLTSNNLANTVMDADPSQDTTISHDLYKHGIITELSSPHANKNDNSCVDMHGL